ncbi:hypothetical protein PR048_013256 [Dryococelus australis]|uniref:DDE-1 domain-containing protein n=1 Tax=Dryococelus australis TaxID=614101 RepID=A0ABQ9HRN2_9NEOP|nr:hypothetical protein PR048_013256 [Dryococelus australis]
MSAYRAAKDFNISLNTVLGHVEGRRGYKSTSHCQPKSLPLDVEKKIAACLINMEQHRFGLSRKDILSLVGEYIVSNNLNTPITDSKLQSDCLISFMRHNLTVKKPESVEIARINCINPFIINNYFEELEKTISQLGLEERPQLTFNLNETSFARDPSKTNVMAASGKKLPPLVIFKGKNLWDDWQPTKEEAFLGTSYVATENVWMEAKVFINFFKITFLAHIGTERPVFVICGGSKTHVSLRLIEIAREENVTILILPPHSLHILQPLDLSVMKSFKNTLCC